MTPGRIGCELAILAVLCVLGIFFFPAIQGPYSVVHGPVTALLAARTAIRLRISIAQAALSAHSLISRLTVLSRVPLWNKESQLTAIPEFSAILRC